ncbi:hypothetical protein [Streptomyces sp. NBC_01477]|uniref:hypothetical protein n=1 Tax=Streptomyces sp. NBC_01477 TaxID=2976015 RepID=UPI002E339712|nr:hypothetical protein [Streptomyces sp. NBC_01477]
MLIGLAVGYGVPADRLTDSPWYVRAAGLLLAIGLYGSTHEIDSGAARRDLRTVVVVVTVGVLLKAAFITGVMILLFRNSDYLVLGIVVAQIDPLSVAAMSRGNRMSDRAKTLLAIWAAFDDPMTVLLSLYLSVVAFRLAGRPGTPELIPGGGGLAGYAENLAGNLMLCAVAVGVWYASREGWKQYEGRRAARERTPAAGRAEDLPRAADVIALVVVLALVLAAATWTLMPAVALAGLLVRLGRFGKWIDPVVTGAFLLAACGLGLLLTDGVSPVAGMVLGTAAFASQAAVASLVPLMMPGLPRSDRVSLMLGQQNGITAVILALALEPDFPGTVGIVGPAVLTVNLLHYASNGLWGRRLRSADAEEDPDGQARLRTRIPRRGREGNEGQEGWDRRADPREPEGPLERVGLPPQTWDPVARPDTIG